MSTIERFKSIYENVEPTLKSYNQKTLTDTIEELINRIEVNQISIMVCGEFKRGKSSLINALLNEDLCQIDENIATSSVSIIKYGEKDCIYRIYETSEGVKEEVISKSDISKYTTGSDLEIDNTIMVVIETPNERLKNGLTIIDTPGVGGLNPRHRYLTLNAMPKADVVFYMVAAGEPITDTELSFFKEIVLPNAKHYRIIFNRVDELNEEQIQSAINDCAKKFIDECGLQGIDVIPVSAWLWNEFNNSGKEDDKNFSHCDKVEEALCNVYEEYRSNLLLLLKNTMLQGLKALRKDIQEQQSLLVDLNPEKQKQLIKKRDLLRNVISDLKANESDIRKRIAKILKQSQNSVLSEISKGNILLSTEKLDKILNNERAIGEDGEKWVLNEVNRDIQKLVSRVDKKIDAAFERAMSLLKQELQIEYEKFYSKIEGELSSPREDSEVVCSLIRQAFPGVTVAGLGSAATFYAGSFISGISSYIGGSAIGILAGGIGATLSALALPIGIVAGAAFIWKSVQNENRARNVAEMKKRISPRIQTMVTDMQTYVTNKFDTFRDYVENYFEETISNLLKQIDAIQKDFQNSQKDSMEISVKKKELEKIIILLNTSITQLGVLLTTPFQNNM